MCASGWRQKNAIFFVLHEDGGVVPPTSSSLKYELVSIPANFNGAIPSYLENPENG
jgi:hypothetical protein